MTMATGLGRILDRIRPRREQDAPNVALPDDLTMIVDRDFGVRLPGRRYFITIRIGRERRTPERLAEEGQQRLPIAIVVYSVLAGAFFMAFGMLCFVYLLKATAGINLFAQDSPLHPLYQLIFG